MASPEWEKETSITLKISSKLVGAWRDIANFRHTDAKEVAQRLTLRSAKLEQRIEEEGGELIYRAPDGTETKVPFFGDWEISFEEE
jgi:hypothetical protein